MGPIDFNKVVDGRPLHSGIDCVIYGGESGFRFRPDDRDWARQAKSQLDEAGVVFFYKQGADYKPGKRATLDGKTYHNWPTPRVPRSDAT